jgi:hypothetical protein
MPGGVAGALRQRLNPYADSAHAHVWAGARGRWTRDDDEVRLDLRHVKPPKAMPPTRATLLDDMRIEVHDIGVFAASRGGAT